MSSTLDGAHRVQREHQIDRDLVTRFTRRIRGDVLRPGEVGYDNARTIWNARFDRRPGLIVRCVQADDVMAGVDLASSEGLPLAVRGGGHDYAGRSACEGGVLLDLSPMSQVRIDQERKLAKVQVGATWGDFDREAQAFHLGTTAATVSTVGVSGYTLGGGTGHLARSHGLAVDNLVAAELVTADAQLVRASETENPDLFWGIRGGGGNFGVAVSLEFALHPVGPDVLAGQIVYRFEDAAEVLRSYRDFITGAPDQLACYAFIIRVPPIDAFAEEHHGELAIDLVVVYAGAIADGRKVIEPLRALANPILDWVEPQPYAAVQQTFDAGTPKGLRWYSKAHMLPGLPDGAIDTILQHAELLPGAFTMVYLEPMGGAIGCVDPTAMAFPHRDAAYNFHVLAGWQDPDDDERLTRWTRGFHQAMAPYSTGGVYVNLLGEDESDRIRAAYGGNYEQLVELKRVWDPQNFFRMNNNIPPYA